MSSEEDLFPKKKPGESNNDYGVRVHKAVEAHFLRPLFPRTLANGKIVRNEECYCGHVRTSHGDRYDVGHGKCDREGCACAQFTFKRRLYAARKVR